MTIRAEKRTSPIHRLVLAGFYASALAMGPLSALSATYGAGRAGAVARHAASGQPVLVWQLKQQTFNPADGTETRNETFSPSATCYQVYVTMESSDASDAMYVQLGTNPQDASEVQSGEEHFFVACHLVEGVMPVLRVIPVPNYDYAGRIITYAIAVLRALPVPFSVDGVSASTSANTLLLEVSKSATLTVHYHLSTGHVSISALSGNNLTKSGKVAGDGGFTTLLAAGLAAIMVQPAPPGRATMEWTVQVGAAPEVRGFDPAAGTVLKQGPRLITALTGAPGQIVLDRTPVKSHYDAATGLLSYVAPAPLASGIHVIEVAGVDGTLAVAHATFSVMPPLAQLPPRMPAGTAGGQAWVSTSTPDGRYALVMPSTWKMAARDGTVLLADPRGEAVVQVSERMLGDAIDASQVAHAIANHLPGKSTFGSAAGGAYFSTTLSGKKGAHATLYFLVKPSLGQHSLLLAAGLSTGGQPALAKEVARVISSFRANGDVAVRRDRSWQRYRSGAFSLDYPVGWMADFTSVDLAVLVGPFDQAYVVGEEMAYSGPTGSADVAAAGKQVAKMLHASLRVQTTRSGPGIYRWMGTYPGNGADDLCVELGQVVVSRGRLQVFWADTSAELAPSNVPVLARSLDSAAQSAGVSPPLIFTVAAAVKGMSTQAPPAMLQGKVSTSRSAPVSANGPTGADTSMNNFNAEMIAQQSAEEMTQQSVQFSDYMNSEYGDGGDIWQPTFYAG